MDNKHYIFMKNSICRTCLETSNDLLSLYEQVNVEDIRDSIDNLLLNCTSIKVVSKNDQYPQFICKLCSNQLKNSFIFRKKCQKSMEELEILHNSFPVSSTPENLKRQDGENLGYNLNKEPIPSDIIYSNGKNHNKTEYDTGPYYSDISNDNESLDNEIEESNFTEYSEKCLKEQKFKYKNDHLNLKQLACNICKKVFTRYSSVKRHMITHTGLKPHSCPFCKRSFTQSGTLSLHLRGHQEYASLKKATQKTNNLHLCSICGKAFKQSSSLTIHLRRHSGDRPYSCNICCKRFISNSKLTSHSRIHSGERPYSCKYCNKSFAQATILNSHLKTHLDAKMHKCNYCSKLFSSAYYLNIHVRKHTGEKPHSCDICQKAFADPKNFKQHQALHTGEKPFLCISCGKTFRRIHHLNVHMSTHSNK